MPISFDKSNDDMFFSKTALLSYFDKMLEFTDTFTYGDIIQRKSLLKTLNLLGIKHDPKGFRSEDEISIFIESLDGKDEMETVLDLYSTNMKSAIASYSKINRVELFDKQVYSMTLIDEDIDEDLPDIYIFDREDFLDYIENIFKENSNSSVLSFLSEIPLEDYINICECTDVLYRDFQMSIDQKNVNSPHDLRAQIGELSIGFRNVMENLLFNDTFYSMPSLSICSILDSILETSNKYKYSDLNRFEAAAFSLKGKVHYLFPVQP